MRARILLVDDDKDTRELVSFYLSEAGYFLQAAADGRQGWEKLQSTRFDLVLLDISMPQVNGFKLLGAMRAAQRFQKLPVIMLTSSADRGHVLHVQALVCDYILKPFEKTDLLYRVARALKKQNSGQSRSFSKPHY